MISRNNRFDLKTPKAGLASGNRFPFRFDRKKPPPAPEGPGSEIILIATSRACLDAQEVVDPALEEVQLASWHEACSSALAMNDRKSGLKRSIRPSTKPVRTDARGRRPDVGLLLSRARQDPEKKRTWVGGFHG